MQYGAMSRVTFFWAMSPDPNPLLRHLSPLPFSRRPSTPSLQPPASSSSSSGLQEEAAMKLDVNALRYLSKEDFRVLTAVEMGMRNHEIVPVELVDRIARLSHGGTYKVLRNLLKHKLVHHDSTKYDGYRLTYLGYDFLAIKTLVNSGKIVSVGRQIGVGKESDIFEVADENGEVLVMKLHRLGRTSFRAVKSKRDYLVHRRSYNWLYLSRLAALKEYAFMKALEDNDFPVPTAVGHNRHCVLMSLVQGYPLVQVKELGNPDEVFDKIIGHVVRLAEHGLIHCDFNEFNIMIDGDENVTMIDFPQMVSVSHRNAQMYFDRDIECIYKFFNKRFNLSSEDNEELEGSETVDARGRPSFFSIQKCAGRLDKELAASGFTRKDQDEMEKFIEEYSEQNDPISDLVDLASEGQASDEVNDAVAVKSDASRVADQLQFEVGTRIVALDSAASRDSDQPETCCDKHKTSTNCHDDDKLENLPSRSNGDGKESLESGQHDDRDALSHAGDEYNVALLTAQVNPAARSNGDVVGDEDDSLYSGGNDDDNVVAEQVHKQRGDGAGDAELASRLYRQRRKAIAAAHGRKASVVSRNAYKDKGKRAMDSKIERQACKW